MVRIQRPDAWFECSVEEGCEVGVYTQIWFRDLIQAEKGSIFASLYSQQRALLT